MILGLVKMFDRRTRFIRSILRLGMWFVLRVLTRTTITGREYLQTPGPVIFAGNHTSTFDAMILFMLPHDAVFVGPADFSLLWPGNWIVHNAGLILMKRGSVERAQLKRLADILNDGGMLGMFPDGGTWEKPIDDVKSGVSYLSATTGAQIVPMAIGGAYRVWWRIATLRFPRVTITFGPPLPPVTITDRKRRQAELEEHAVGLMHILYAMLPPETQALYDLRARQQFSGELVFQPPIVAAPEVDFSTLAELVSKPNLFSPLYRNARLPVRPLLRHGHYFSVASMKRAVDALYDAFSTGDYTEYLPYRLGEAKAASICTALEAISAALATVETQRVRVAFVATVTERKPTML